MKHASYDSFPEKANPHGVSVRTLYDHAEAQAIHILLRPGETLKRHITPVDVFFYILEGEGKVEIGEETVHVVKDMIVESPSKVPHRLYNDGIGDMRFLVVKTPRPVEKTSIL